MATLSQCTHDGIQYYDEHNDFGLEIPAGAISEGDTITIDIGVAVYGPFQYTEGLRPVSPVFWVCVRDHKNFKFLKAVKFTIPHCLHLENHDDIESLGLTFLRGDHKMNPQQMYLFQQAEGEVFIEPLLKYGVFQSTHFCSLCISSQVTKEFIQKAMFCISALSPPSIPVTDSATAYFFITFLLKTCLNVVEKQISQNSLIRGHKKEAQTFKFGEVQSLEIILPQSLPDSWQVGVIFRKKVCY